MREPLGELALMNDLESSNLDWEAHALETALVGLGETMEMLFDQCECVMMCRDKSHDYQGSSEPEGYFPHLRSLRLVCPRKRVYEPLLKELKKISNRYNALMGPIAIFLFPDSQSFEAHKTGAQLNYQIVEKFLVEQKAFYLCFDEATSHYLVTPEYWFQHYCLNDLEGEWIEDV